MSNNPAFRDFGSFCPRRYDIHVPETMATSIVPNAVRYRSVPQIHDWRQEIVFSAEGSPIDGVFYCARCLARIYATVDGQRAIQRYYAETEELEAWNQSMQEQREAQTEQFNEIS